MSKEEFKIENLIPHNRGLLMEPVIYGPGNPFDNEDKSNHWLRVVIAPPAEPKIEAGDLVIYNARLHVERVINGKTYAIGECDQVLFILKKENVKESLFG